MPDMTPEQRKLARHALGFDQGPRKVSYRNRYSTSGTTGPAHLAWEDMLAKGWAACVRPNPKKGERMTHWWLTRAGALLALEPGERLDREDFPDV